MPFFNEEQLEKSIIQLFQEQGYEYTLGEEIERQPDEVLLRNDLFAYLRERYASDNLTDNEIDRIIRFIKEKTGGSLYEENCRFMRLLTEGFTFKRDNASLPTLFISPVSFDDPHKKHNIFRIVNQFEVRGVEKKRIPDGIVFVNGLPLVVLEFKSAIKEETTIHDAFTQLTVRYTRDIPELLRFNAFVVVSDGINNRYGSLFASYEYFSAWRKVQPNEKPVDGIPTLETMVHGLFEQGRFLDMLHNFIYIPDTSKNNAKIVARYPQYYGARALYNNILNHSKLNEGGDGKGGTYFGATGCGKSFTMLFLARLLMRSKALCSPTILLITDRTDLDDQLSRDVLNAKQFIGDENIIQVDSRESLKTYLKNQTSGGVFLTTIQKFAKDFDELSPRRNIICISDEAHRSQLSLEEKVEITDTGVRRSFGFAKYLHDSLPNATYVGFTGTPIDATLEVFGPIVDEYTMIDAVNDEVTRRIVYEGRASKVIIDPGKLELIEKYYDKCSEEGSSEYQIEESKKAMTKMKELLANPDLLKRIADDFINHYETRIAEGTTVEGKAMIVCPSREIAYGIYKDIAAQRPDWTEVRDCPPGVTLTDVEKTKIKPIEMMKMIFIRDKDDPKELWDLLGPDEERKKLDLQFKEPKSNFKIAIVVDMWITGFDVPCLDTLYCYKPLQMHSLIQTISRVNRPYPGKDKGLIVDYLGIKRNMNAAMQKYANGGVGETPVEVVDEAVKLFKDELSVLNGYFHGFDISPFFSGTPLEQLNCLKSGADRMLRTKEQEQDFMKHTNIMKQTYNVCLNDDRITRDEIEHVHFYSGVRAVIYKMTKGEAPDAATMNQHVLELVNDAIVSDEVEVINNIGMNNTSQIDLLAHQYMEKVEQIPYENLKVKLMERLLKQVINSVKRVNKIKAVDFSERLKSIVDRYNDRTDDLVFAQEVIQEVTQKLVDLLADIAKENTLPDGVPNIEVKAFFDILIAVAKQHDFYENYTEAEYAEMANKIKEIVDNKSQYVDWSRRDDIRAEMQVAIIIELSNHGFPPVSCTEVYKAVIDQAENFKLNQQVQVNNYYLGGDLNMAAEGDINIDTIVQHPEQ